MGNEKKKNSHYLSYQSLVSIKENTDRKRKKEERKKKNTDRTQTKLNAPHVRYNVKTLPQQFMFQNNFLNKIEVDFLQ